MLEERWRDIDVVSMRRKEMMSKMKRNPMQTTRTDEIKFASATVEGLTEDEVYEKLEGYAKNKLKVPVNNKQSISKEKITNTDATNFLSYAMKQPAIGSINYRESHMADVLKHDYLKKSIEERAYRKALFHEFVENQNRSDRFYKGGKPTKTSLMRKDGAASACDISQSARSHSCQSELNNFENQRQKLRERLFLL